MGKSFTILGAGSWGTALAILLSRNGHSVMLWDRDAEHIAAAKQARCNSRYLPDISFPESLQLSANIVEALEGAEYLLIAVPSHGFREILQKSLSCINQDTQLVWATKGVDPGTGKLLHEVIQDVMGYQRSMAIVSGPTFAHEVAVGLPTAITVASNNSEFADEIAACLNNECFRAYTSTDMIGVGVGGAVKNVLAIAAGVADGLGFGANTRAALITRGLAEMMRFGIAMGGQRETFMGLAGLGDLVLTCTDDQSRNRRLGLLLADGKSLDEALHNIGQVVEGVQTAAEIMTLANDKDIEMPITEQVYQVLYQDRSPRDAVNTLFARVPKSEST